MKIIVRFFLGPRCTGCGAIGLVEEKNLLCAQCFGLVMAVELRKRKLTSTLSQRFARRVWAAGLW